MAPQNKPVKQDKIEQEFRFSRKRNRANEINWREWGDKAFEEAKQQDKPILLDISAFWCHWCHVMDETTYSDDDVIRMINEYFIPIRVDTDKRPDVNRRYNQEGWPTTAFLTPTGELLSGNTYVSANQMRQSLGEIKDFYHNNKSIVDVAASEMHRLEHARPEEPAIGQVTEDIVDDVAGIIRRAFDPDFGGFGRQAKFPHVPALEFALESYYLTGEEAWANVVNKTLKAMASSEVYDKVEGGFFRYTTRREWRAPHYEKMLEDNAALLRMYLLAFQATGEKEYQDVALGVIGYLESNLYDPKTGGFYGSQDADEDYYRSDASKRATKIPPAVDKVLYTDWNAQLASSYFIAYQVLGDSNYLSKAVAILDFLWNHSFSASVGVYHFWDGQARLDSLLQDQVNVLLALLDAYETTGETLYLGRALQLTDLIQSDYQDVDAGGFFDISVDRAQLGELGVRDKFLGDNSLIASALTKLYRLTGADMYRPLAYQALKISTDDYRRYGLFAATYGMAVSHFLHAAAVVTIVGQVGNAQTQALLHTALEIYKPNKVVRVLNPVSDADELAALGYDGKQAPAAFVCRDKACSAPVDQADQLASLLNS